MNISIKDKIGARCVDKRDGQKIYDSIYEPLKRNEPVTLNFEGVTQFAGPFFNSAVGQLLEDIKEKDLRQLLHCENLNETGKHIFERVIENAIQYHNRDYKKMANDILKFIKQ